MWCHSKRMGVGFEVKNIQKPNLLEGLVILNTKFHRDERDVCGVALQKLYNFEKETT